MKNSYIITILLLISISFAESMDPKRFKAWSVEHEEYRALFEDQLKQYLNIQNNQKLPLLRKHDKLIIIQLNN